MEEDEDPIAGGKTGFLINNKTKQTRQDWTQDVRRWHMALGNEPTRNCKHREILKGANEEGNEGKQLGKMYQ